MSRSEMTVNTTYFEFTVSNTTKNEKDFHYFWSVPSTSGSDMPVNTTYFELMISNKSKHDKDFHYFWSVPCM